MSILSTVELYWIDSPDVDHLTAEEALSFVKENYGKAAVCRNILEFQITYEELTQNFEIMIKTDRKLRDDMIKEIETGANYMFIRSEGEPLLFGKPLSEIEFIS